MAHTTFVHDCTGCIFLGSYTWRGQLHDLYTCKQGRNWPTVIARHSSEGPDYCSGLESALVYEMYGTDEEERNHPLVEAMRRARENGHILTKEPNEESARL